MEKARQISEEDLLKELSQNINDFGKSLKVWEGKEIKEIGKPFGKAVKSLMFTYKKTNNPNFLLSSFILQMVFSFIFARGMMSEMMKTKYVYPKNKMEKLADKVIELAKVVNTEKFVPTLTSILMFAYQNGLLPMIEKEES